MPIPQAGGPLTINNRPLGNFDYTVEDGPVTIDTFSSLDWFTDDEDDHSAWIVIKGDLTIDAGQTVIPSVRKLFTVVYVDGDLTLNGTISMTARGSNHRGDGVSGGEVTAATLRIAEGVAVPAQGADGGASKTSNGQGNAGSNGADGATGGGGSGANFEQNSGAGAAGSSFSGGPGGGGGSGANGQPGEAFGGAGGDGGDANAAGGAGNPPGSATDDSKEADPGTGGILIVICTGTLTGSGSVVSAGSDGAQGNSISGGGSGGGSVTLMYGADSSTVTVDASGGAGGAGTTFRGGDGGDGTARKLPLT